MKYTYVTFCTLGLIFSVGTSAVVFAQDTGATPVSATTPRERIIEARKDIRTIKEDRNDTIKEERQELQGDIKTIRTTAGTTTPAGRAEVRNEIRDRVETGRAEMEEERTEARAQIEEKRQEIQSEVEKRRMEQIGKIATVLGKRHEAAYKRLVTIRERIASRIEEMKEKGADTTAAQTALTSADASLALSKTEVDSLLTAIAAATSEGATREALARVRTQAEVTASVIRGAHARLVEAVAALKPGRNKAPVAPATTTPTSSATN